MNMIVIDLFSGLGGFSEAFVRRGHHVIRIDIERAFKPDIQADVRFLPIKPSIKPDVLLASPPCEEFSKSSMPWCRDADIDKGMELVHATDGAINCLKPRFWVVENVKGAVRYFKEVFGNYRQRCGSRYLWGNFPRFKCKHERCYGKTRITGKRKDLRSIIPYEISLNLCKAIESAIYIPNISRYHNFKPYDNNYYPHKKHKQKQQNPF